MAVCSLCDVEGAELVAPVGGMEVAMCSACVNEWDAAAQAHPAFKALYGKSPKAIAARVSLEGELRVFAETWTAGRKATSKVGG